MGDVILFLDSDVVVYPDYLEKILKVFETKLNALGAQGWNVPKNVKLRKTNSLLKFYAFNSIKRVFLIQHYTTDSCKYSEYPIILTKIIDCSYLQGSNMAFRREIFRQFKFDENLKGYSYMEDLLLSHLIHKKYPNCLYITPHAKCIHKVSEEGRTEMSLFESPHKRRCRKYVLTKYLV